MKYDRYFRDRNENGPAVWLRKTSVQERSFIVAVLFCASPFVSPPVALVIGSLFALTVGHPFQHINQKGIAVLLQVSVVGLGFGMDLMKIMEISAEGFPFTVASIVATLIIGYSVGRWLNIHQKTSHLISSGTAICGGSAIAAIAPILNATPSEMAVSLSTVFILNSVALIVFPLVGHALHLTQAQFGFWAGIAIHDTSSVVGAAAKYGEAALHIATTVKLARALWIVPVAVVTSFVFKNKLSKMPVPYFIMYFLGASMVRTYIPSISGMSEHIVHISKTALTVTLFLVGAGLSKEALKAVGIKPLLHGVILWIIISAAALLIIVKTV